MFPKRQGIIVWLHSLKYGKQLRKFGNIHYISKRLKYAVLYCDMEQVDHVMKKLAALPFVKRVEPSYRPFLRLEFESKGEKEKEKEKDSPYPLG
ncbi:YlbG family protein [Geobacillus thermodenitrificans]|uniref:YlbG family protein n=2 Tax=Geobacillus TaxID=129337 RepID=UPI003D1F18CA